MVRVAYDMGTTLPLLPAHYKCHRYGSRFDPLDYYCFLAFMMGKLR